MFRAKSDAIIRAGSRLRIGFLFVSVCLAASSVWADLEITASKENKAANDPLVMVRSTMTDPGGTTSLRFSTDKTIAKNL
jgi:hypothetical protein